MYENAAELSCVLNLAKPKPTHVGALIMWGRMEFLERMPPPLHDLGQHENIRLLPGDLHAGNAIAPYVWALVKEGNPAAADSTAKGRGDPTGTPELLDHAGEQSVLNRRDALQLTHLLSEFINIVRGEDGVGGTTSLDRFERVLGLERWSDVERVFGPVRRAYLVSLDESHDLGKSFKRNGVSRLVVEPNVRAPALKR